MIYAISIRAILELSILLSLGRHRSASFSMYRRSHLTQSLVRRHTHSRTRIFSTKKSLILPKDDQPIQTIAAPMVAASDYAFRCLCRQYGVDLTYTQMLHTTNLLKDKQFGRHHLDLWEYTPPPSKWLRTQENLLEDPGGKSFLQPSFDQETFERAKRGPTVVQLAGHDPTTVVNAAKLILEQTDGQVHGFDLNLGK